MNESEASETKTLCSISHCSRTAVESERAETDHWVIVIHYCDEHMRELNRGVPVGPVGLDNSRIEVQPKGKAEPESGGTLHAIGPH